MSACELTGVNAAASYYGGGVVNHADKKAKCPVMMHFGELDAHIPMSDVEQIRQGNPTRRFSAMMQITVLIAITEEAMIRLLQVLALSRTLEFFAQHVSG